MKKVRKILLLSAFITLCLSACGRMASLESQTPASSENITSGSAVQTADPAIDALEAYQDFLSQEEYLIENENEDIMEKTHFAICDLDTNGIPELLISGSFNMLNLGEYYTYENGTVTEIEGPGEGEGYPVPGSLSTMPSRNTYVYFRGGPAYSNEEEEDDGNPYYMPYCLIEYKLENHQIHMVNHADWQICYSDNKPDITEYTFNGEKCTGEEIMNRYSLKMTKTEEGIDQCNFPEESSCIELLPNTEANRKAIITGPDSTISP